MGDIVSRFLNVPTVGSRIRIIRDRTGENIQVCHHFWSVGEMATIREIDTSNHGTAYIAYPNDKHRGGYQILKREDFEVIEWAT